MSGGEGGCPYIYTPGGERVKGTVSGVVTVYVGNHYEKQGTTVRKYYYVGSQRVAMRENTTLYWLLTDHLGSTAIVANAGGAKVGEVRYKAWGEDRYTSGTTPTTYRYTGQRWEVGIGLYFYNARWYDPALGRFVQPDTVVPKPGDPQQLSRFSYARNAPMNYTDPSGHAAEAGLGAGICDYEDLAREYERAADQVSTEAYGGWLQEYMARNAVRYKALAEFGATPEDPNVAAYIEDLGNGVAWAKERLLVNGYAGRDVALDTAYRSSGGPTFLMEIGPALMGLPGLVGAATWRSGQRFDPNQEALIDLAQEAKQRGGVTTDEANTLLDWAQEYGLPARIDDKGHPSRGFGRIPHIHIGPVGHIPIK